LGFIDVVGPSEVKKLFSARPSNLQPEEVAFVALASLAMGWIVQPLIIQKPATTWDIEYGDGSWISGVVGFDQIDVGGIKVRNQAVKLAKRFHGKEFFQGSADGVIGLAFDNLNSVSHSRVLTPLESMIAQSLLHEQVFTVSLGREPFFSFGVMDEDIRADRDIHFVDIDDRTEFWMFNSRYARIGGNLYRRVAGAAIPDTGANIMLTDPFLVSRIYDQIEGAMYDDRKPGWVYPKG